MRRAELEGKTFGRLRVQGLSDKYPERSSLYWICACQCGKTRVVDSWRLLSGTTKSCGCLHTDTITTHGMSNLPEYRIWASMIHRCSNKDSQVYRHYGGRGISVCKRWHQFENFISDIGRRPSPELTIERRDNNLGYSLDNCYWATRTQQRMNQSKQKNNTTGTVGVYLLCTGKYLAKIEFGGIRHHLGHFDEIEDAIEARIRGEKKYQIEAI